jgi:hypothetical protein
MKVGIVEPKQTAVARQQLSKYFPAATIAQLNIEELLDAVFSMRFVSHEILNK